MCFSASASIGSSIVLTTLGVLTLKNAKSNKQLLYIAWIPCLFALQQLSEGIVWLSLNGLQPFESVFEFSQYLFLFFALAVWPVWIPFSVLMAENKPNRRLVLLLILSIGIALAGFNLYELYLQKSNARAFFNSIHYGLHLPDIEWIYFIPVIFPSLISSLRSMWQFGVLILAAAIVSEYLYEETYLSVWCFFSAIVSVSILKIIRDNVEMPSTDYLETVKNRIVDRFNNFFR